MVLQGFSSSLCSKHFRRFVIAAAAGLIGTLPTTTLAAAPATVFWDGEHLASIRANPAESSPEVKAGLARLKRDANQALRSGPYSVVDKEIVPPTGDKHDYLSFSRYWWPNPDTADGLPYIRRDGDVNRELLARGDRVRIGQFYDDFESLALAAYLVDQDKYAPHAVLLLRTWFLDPETRMNPNLQFAQGVPGRATGRAPGIIDTRHFIRVLDGVELLEAIGAFPATDRAELTAWFRDFLSWLGEHPLAIKEQAAKNNHGSWFAAQAVRIALFVGDYEKARQMVHQVRDERIPAMIQVDGSQPTELTRTRSLHYSLFNLVALATVARAGERLGIDLWDTIAPCGERLKLALDYAAPYSVQAENWPHEEKPGFTLAESERQLLVLAASRLKDASYARIEREAPANLKRRSYVRLLFPSGQPPKTNRKQR